MRETVFTVDRKEGQEPVSCEGLMRTLFLTDCVHSTVGTVLVQTSHGLPVRMRYSVTNRTSWFSH